MYTHIHTLTHTREEYAERYAQEVEQAFLIGKRRGTGTLEDGRPLRDATPMLY